MKVLVFDTETTGLPVSSAAPLSKQPHIIEFAGLVLDHRQRIARRLNFLVKPPVPIAPEITRITGIDDLMVRESLSWKAWHDDVEKEWNKARFVVAHNFAFDAFVLACEAKRCGKKPFSAPIKQTALCTVELTKHYEGKRLKLSELHEKVLGEEMKVAHRAMADVEALANIVKAKWSEFVEPWLGREA